MALATLFWVGWQVGAWLQVPQIFAPAWADRKSSSRILIGGLRKARAYACCVWVLSGFLTGGTAWPVNSWYLKGHAVDVVSNCQPGLYNGLWVACSFVLTVRHAAAAGEWFLYFGSLSMPNHFLVPQLHLTTSLWRVPDLEPHHVAWPFLYSPVNIFNLLKVQVGWGS